jgi:hypothetical protein
MQESTQNKSVSVQLAHSPKETQTLGTVDLHELHRVNRLALAL